MGSPYDRMREIEHSSPVNDIKYKGESYWPLFRSLMLTEISFSKDYKKIIKSTSILKKALTAPFGFFNWFGRYDYIAFSNYLEQKFVDDSYIDKLLEKTINDLGYNKVLYIENANQHLKKAHYGKKKIVSWNLILLVIGFVSKISFLKNRFLGEEIVEDIIKRERLNLKPRIKLKEFLAKVVVLKILFKIYRPKCILLTDYGSFPMIYAAKKLGIRTIEYQHGIIGKVHPFYHPYIKLNPMFCPDYLFAFGAYDKQSLDSGNYVDVESIFPIGNFYLELMFNRKPNTDIVDLLKTYRASVCIPTNILTQEFLYNFVNEAALKLPEVIFIIVPRDYGHFVPLMDKINTSNIHVENKHSFQETVRHCKFNMSTISTCNLEAISLGVQNILIEDSRKLTRTYYGKLLDDKSATKFVDTVDEFVECLNSFEPIEKEQIVNSNYKNYTPNYSKNLNSALTKVLE